MVGVWSLPLYCLNKQFNLDRLTTENFWNWWLDVWEESSLSSGLCCLHITCLEASYGFLLENSSFSCSSESKALKFWPLEMAWLCNLVEPTFPLRFFAQAKSLDAVTTGTERILSAWDISVAWEASDTVSYDDDFRDSRDWVAPFVLRPYARPPLFLQANWVVLSPSLA